MFFSSFIRNSERLFLRDSFSLSFCCINKNLSKPLSLVRTALIEQRKYEICGVKSSGFVFLQCFKRF